MKRIKHFINKLFGGPMIHVYLETRPGSELYNYRGEAGPNDDPQSFKKLMKKKDLRVYLAPEFQGQQIRHKEV